MYRKSEKIPRVPAQSEEVSLQVETASVKESVFWFQRTMWTVRIDGSAPITHFMTHESSLNAVFILV